MTIKDVLEAVKNAVLDVKKENHDVISVDALTHYLDGLIKDTEGQESVDQKVFEANLTVFQAEQAAKIEGYRAEQIHDTEMFRSVIRFAEAALRSSMLINGGAAVAVMAFIGNIWTKEVSQLAVTSLTTAIYSFSLGVLAAGFATMSSYFTQYFYHQDLNGLGVVFHVLSIIIGIGAFVFFGYGAYEVYTSFAEHLGSRITIPTP